MAGYYPTKQELDLFVEANKNAIVTTKPQFAPKFMTRSDKLNVDETIAMLDKKSAKCRNVAKKKQIDALKSRLMSVSDLTPKLYDTFDANPNALSNWFPAVEKAAAKQSFFKIPETKVWTLPIELAQFIRLEYSQTNAVSRELFNDILFENFELKDDKTYFIKTGTFSSKFEFRNAKCSEPREMGDYFIVINNFAMEVGAAHSVDIVVREFIEDPENRPTIYSGMPLRTEFRAFVDFDKNELIGIVPYWFPSVMRNRFKVMENATVEQDYHTYMAFEDTLMADYEKHLSVVKSNVKALIPNIELTGKYSLDIMKSGEDFYIIDMATMETSAMADFVTKEGISYY